MKKINLVLIDDEATELDKYKFHFEKGLEENYSVKTQVIKFDEINENFDILNSLYTDAIFVDQQLFDKNQEKNESKEDIGTKTSNKLKINGVTLAMHLRQNYPNTPIFIFTNNYIPNIKESNFFDSEEYIDEFFIKGDFNDITQIKYSDFLKIVEGYQDLKEHNIKSINDLISALSIPKSNYDLIHDDVLEVISQKLFSLKHDSLYNYKIAKWVRKTLMNYPGLLYDEIHAATFFGMTVESFKKASIQDFFKSAKYTGLFSNEKEMWWKSELIECIDNFLDFEEKQMPYSHGFRCGWEKNKLEKLDPAVCIYSQETPADWVCCVLNEPVKIKYTLKYLDNDRPSIMDEARISFKAIDEDDYDTERIESESMKIYENLPLKGDKD